MFCLWIYILMNFDCLVLWTKKRLDRPLSMTILLMIFWFPWADINTILWILLASLAGWCSDYTAWFLSPCPKLWHKCLWIMSWWSLPNLWEMVFVFQDSSSVGNFWLSKRCKDPAGTDLCHSTFVISFSLLWGAAC